MFRRGALITGIFAVGLSAHALCRLVDRIRPASARRLSPFVVQWVCRGVFWALGLTHTVKGTPMTGGGAVVANHSSWLDIFALNARQPVTFVSKAEVASWPGIGLLGRVTGTLFIRRDRKEARRQTQLFVQRLTSGQTLLFFPEGTSTDGQSVLPFNPTLFAAFFAPELRDSLQVQPVTVTYFAPPNVDRRVYGWWGDMDFASHALQMLALPKHGRITVTYHPPLRVMDHPDRKALAKAAYAKVAQVAGPKD